MKKIEPLIGPALRAVENCLAAASNIGGKKDIVAKEYDEYVASFGASLRTAGLLPTLAFYTDIHKEDKPGKPRRWHVLKTLFQIIEPESPWKNHKNGLLRHAFSLAYGRDVMEDTQTINSDLLPNRELERTLTEASIALKLVLRNFKQNESE